MLLHTIIRHNICSK